MAEDGMLLNFSIGDGTVAAKPSFKGGRWKDRLTAKKAAKYRQSRLAGEGKPRAPEEQSTQAPQELETFSEPHARPIKRQRIDEDYRPASIAKAAQSVDRQPASGHGQVKGQPKQIVSSLFTYNPTSITKAEEKRDGEADAPVEPSNAPLQSELDTFTSLGLSKPIANHLLNKLNLKMPTAIQKAAISQLLKEDSDAFIQAETGSGKTLAYLLPIVQRIMTLSWAMKEQGTDEDNAVHRDSGLFAIILTPSRELSKQISVVLDSLLRCAHWIVAGTVLGGEKKKSEKARLRKGLNILIATPGRLADHLDHTEALDVSNVRWLVLDEGDRLMELGFEQEIQKIVSKLNLRMRKTTGPKIPGLPAKRTTVLCSATMKMNVQRLGEISLKDAVHIHADPADKSGEEDAEADSQEVAFSAPAQLKQSYAVVPAKLRLVTLVAVLRRAFTRRGSVMKAIVFISCADSVDFHYDVLTRQDSDFSPTASPSSDANLTTNDLSNPAAARSSSQTLAPAPSISPKSNPVHACKLHGSLPQPIRTSTLASFTHSRDPAVLLCTDVASRGLDLPNVDFVLEYDPAFSREDHLHRVGRTARAGRDGRAMVFLQPGPEEGYVKVLEQDGGKGVRRHDADELLRKGFGDPGLAATGTSNASGNNITPQKWDEAATTYQLATERWALSHAATLERARRAFQSHVRAYATHVAAERGFFDIKALHLGHLAKAFGLRDRPGEMRVPGLRPAAGGVSGWAKAVEKGVAKGKGMGTEQGKGREKGRRDGQQQQQRQKRDHDVPGARDAEEARRKMRAMARMAGAGASEFNLG